MDHNEKILIGLLRFGGAVMLMALGAVIMPSEWMSVIHQRLALGELPQGPIVGYLTRSVSVLYALHGALLLFLASDLRRYLPVVRFLAVAGVFFGVVIIGIDYFVGMPVWWTVGEGVSVIGFGVVILWLTGLKRFPSANTGA